MQDTEQQAQVRLSRHYRASPEKVWRAWTDPQALNQWFGPGGTGEPTRAEVDLRVGGRFRIAFSGSKGEAHEASGVYQEVEPHRRLVFSWFWKSTPERVSRVSIELQPMDGGCQLSFLHDRFFDQTAADNHARGWPVFFDKLGEFLQTTVEA
jgi:uncharacterized protein YndB with AHSA1/START domain